jgi:hypothetical protein
MSPGRRTSFPLVTIPLELPSLGTAPRPRHRPTRSTGKRIGRTCSHRRKRSRDRGRSPSEVGQRNRAIEARNEGRIEEWTEAWAVGRDEALSERMIRSMWAAEEWRRRRRKGCRGEKAEKAGESLPRPADRLEELVGACE